MRNSVLFLILMCSFIFGLKAQNREIVDLDCTHESVQKSDVIVYGKLLIDKEYYINFPHSLDLEKSTDFLSNLETEKVYWKDHMLFFTSKSEFVYFNYPGIDPTQDIINCKSFNVSPASALMMMGIEVEKNTPIETLIEQDLLGDFCLQATGIQGPNNSNRFGTFTNGMSSIGIEEGILLVTGDVNSAEGPNGGESSNGNGTDGTDPDIASIISNSQHNVTKIEFDFVPDEDMISFDYVFSSEEYCNYVNSTFNDIFGFFISGPGINGPFTNGAENIAVIPGSALPVTINNLNWGSFGEFYNTNTNDGVTGGCTVGEINAPKPFSSLFGFDGFTTVLQAQSEVVPCETYHIKIVIADIGDGQLDSGIFLGKNSFISGNADTKVTIIDGVKDGSDVAEEGCENAYIAFGIEPPSTIDIDVTFQILGTSSATAGVDFENLPPSYTIPAGEGADTLWIDIFSDYLIEGIETIDLQISGLCDCDDPIITIEIEDPPIYEKDYEICQGETLETAEGEISEPGQYLSIVETPGECDSLILYNLSIIPAPLYDTTIYRCILEPLYFLGEEFLFAPATKDILIPGSSAQGCDSLIRVNFQWVNPDLLVGVTDIISCTNPDVDVYIINNPIPANIDSYEWVTPDLDTLMGDTINVTIPGDYQLLSYIELEDRTCSNFFLNEIEVVADSLIPLIEPLNDLTVICGLEIPDIIGNVENQDDFTNLELSWTVPDGSSVDGIMITPSDEGEYIFTAENPENGCISMQSFEFITENIIPEILIDDASIGCNAPFITLQSYVDIEGGVYNWSGPNGFSSSQPNPQVSEPGSYSLEYSISSICSNTSTIDLISDDSLPEITAIGDTIICGQGTGFLNFNANNLLEFNWTGPNGFTSTDSMPEVTEEGMYTIEVIAQNGCSDTENVNLEFIDIIPVVTVEDTSLNCNISIIELVAQVDDPNLIIEWSGPNNFNSSELNPTINEAGQYTINVTNLEGCEESQTLVVEIDTIAPPLELVGTNLDCVADQATISTSTNNIISYSWTGPNNYSSNSDEITVQTPGNYTLEVLSSNGCTTSEEITVAVDTITPTFEVFSDTLDCNTGQAELFVDFSNTNYTIQWYDQNDEFIIENTNSIIVENDGEYFVNIIDTSNNCIATSPLLVSPNELTPDINLTGDLITCEDKEFNIFSNSSFNNLQYNWTGPNGFISNNQNPEITTEGIYSLEITSDQNCKNNQDIIVSSDLTTPTVEVNGDTLNCLNTEINLSLNTFDEQYSYLWTSNNGFNSDIKNPLVNEAGNYSVLITGDNFCDTIVSLDIAIDTAILNIQGQVSNILDCTNLTADISIETDYLTSVEYEWSGPSNYYSDTKSIEISESGLYELTVTAQNGCTRMEEYTVEGDYSTIDITTTNGIINCYQESTLLQTVLSSNDYQSILWQGPSMFESADLQPLVDEEGTYELTVIGQNGCTSTEELIIVADFEEPLVELNNGQLSCNNSSVEIINSLDEEYSYEWTESNSTDVISTSSTLTVDKEGIYTALITNESNGCINEDNSLITQLPDFSGFDVEIDNPDCFNPKGNIEILNISGGTEPFQFSIDGGITFQDNPVFADLDAGEFQVVIQDEYECNDSMTTSIVSLQAFELSSDGSFLIFVGENQQIMVETGLDENNIESITWSPDINLSCTDCLNPISTTASDIIYTITVIDKDGCIYEAEIEIRVLENPYYVPNVFTPNDDGNNEFFSIFGDLELIQNVNTFSIYDRWGERVFFTENVLATDESMKWYGNFKGEPAQAGVYAYYLEYISLSGNIIRMKGDVTILR